MVSVAWAPRPRILLQNEWARRPRHLRLHSPPSASGHLRCERIFGVVAATRTRRCFTDDDLRSFFELVRLNFGVRSVGQPKPRPQRLGELAIFDPDRSKVSTLTGTALRAWQRARISRRISARISPALPGAGSGPGIL